MPGTCLFPLRTNAGFYRQAGFLDLGHRLKESCLLYDEMIIEDGLYIADIGPTTAVEIVGPTDRIDAPDYRKFAPSKGNFGLYVNGHAFAQEEVVRRFVCEFDSYIEQIMKANDGSLPEWVQLIAFKLKPEGATELNDLTRIDTADARILGRKHKPLSSGTCDPKSQSRSATQPRNERCSFYGWLFPGNGSPQGRCCAPSVRRCGAELARSKP